MCYVLLKDPVRTPQSTLSVSAIMLYREIIAVCSEIHIKQTLITFVGKTWKLVILNLLVHEVTTGL